jgi:hypothetical protein
MAYDPKTRTITIDSDSSYLADSGVHFVSTYREIAKSNDAPPAIRNDWKIIEEWLGCSGRDLNNEDMDRIRKAWYGYCAVGVAPSKETQPAFDMYSKMPSVKKFLKDKPPTYIMDIFDRMMASEEDIAKHKSAYFEEEMKPFKALFESMPKKQNKSNLQNIKQKLHTIPRVKRIFITFSICWSVWVIFRTSGYYEILGIELNSWNKDMFLVNLFAPPVFVFVLYKLLNWIRAAEK